MKITTKGVIFLLVGGLISLILIFMGSIFTYTSITVEKTWFIEGDPTKFDPIAEFPKAHEHAGLDTKLLAIEARFVRIDGTMDLKAEYVPAPQTSYEFFRELKETPTNAAPLGAGNSNEGKWYEPVAVEVYKPWQMRQVTTMGKNENTEYQYYNLGMDLKNSTPVSTVPGAVAPDPLCNFKQLWDIALTKEAPSTAVATITYDEKGYNFRISKTKINLHFGMDCKLINDDQE